MMIRQYYRNSLSSIKLKTHVACKQGSSGTGPLQSSKVLFCHSRNQGTLPVLHTLFVHPLHPCASFNFFQLIRRLKEDISNSNSIIYMLLTKFKGVPINHSMSGQIRVYPYVRQTFLRLLYAEQSRRPSPTYHAGAWTGPYVLTLLRYNDRSGPQSGRWAV